MEVVATARWVRITARKARLVAATVEGLPVTEALTVLSFTPRAAARDVAKVIKSAAANAEHNYNLDTSDLRVARIEIDGASIIKRFRPRAQGRAFSVFKRTAHLRAYVTDERPQRVERAARPKRRPAAVSEEELHAPRRRRAATAATTATATKEAQAEAPAARRPRAKKGPEAEPAPADLEGSVSAAEATTTTPDVSTSGVPEADARTSTEVRPRNRSSEEPEETMSEEQPE